MTAIRVTTPADRQLHPGGGAHNGYVTLSADGSRTYVHDRSATVSDSFVYEVCDTGSLRDTATVNRTITAGTSTMSFTPTDDAMVTSRSAATNCGASASLEVRSHSQETIHSYLKFNITAVTGTISSAKVRLYADKASTEAGSVCLVPNDNPWIESALTRENAPGLEGRHSAQLQW